MKNSKAYIRSLVTSCVIWMCQVDSCEDKDRKSSKTTLFKNCKVISRWWADKMVRFSNLMVTPKTNDLEARMGAGGANSEEHQL